jgi:hypothetical protein
MVRRSDEGCSATQSRRGGIYEAVNDAVQVQCRRSTLGGMGWWVRLSTQGHFMYFSV